MQCFIKTKTSFLNVYSFEKYGELIKKCIENIKDEFLIKAPNQLYMKTDYKMRRLGFFSDVSFNYYHYSVLISKPKPLHPDLAELMKIINANYGTNYNGVLVNKYEDGNDCIPDHCDDEKTLDKVGVINISYGAVRTLRIRDKLTKKIIMDIPLISNSITHMGGNFQKDFTHEVPVEKDVKGVRYSLSFRTLTE